MLKISLKNLSMYFLQCFVLQKMLTYVQKNDAKAGKNMRQMSLCFTNSDIILTQVKKKKFDSPQNFSKQIILEFFVMLLCLLLYSWTS